MTAKAQLLADLDLYATIQAEKVLADGVMYGSGKRYTRYLINYAVGTGLPSAVKPQSRAIEMVVQDEGGAGEDAIWIGQSFYRIELEVYKYASNNLAPTEHLGNVRLLSQRAAQAQVFDHSNNVLRPLNFFLEDDGSATVYDYPPSAPVDQPRGPIMYAAGSYQPSEPQHYRGDVVSYQDYLSCAMVDTEQYPIPQGSGVEAWVAGYPDTPAVEEVEISTDVLMIGTRIRVQEYQIVKQARIWVQEINANVDHELWVVDWPTDPEKIHWEIVSRFVPSQVGWNMISVPNDITRPGEEFDIVHVMTSSTQAETWSGTWQSKNENGNPSSGEMNHQSNGQMRFHNTDKNDVDQTANLATLAPGSTIQFMASGAVYTVNAVDLRGSHARFDCSPMTRQSEEEQAFQFVTQAAVPIKYGRIVDYHIGQPNLDGIYTTEGYFQDDGKINQNGYLIDVFAENAVFSTDWWIMVWPPRGQT